MCGLLAGVPPLVPALIRLSVLLAEPEPSGGTGPSRRCRGCFPPFLAPPRSGCPQLHQPAATAQRRSPSISARPHGASWRTRSTFHRCRPSRVEDSTMRPGDPRRDPTTPQISPVGRAVVPLIAVELAGPAAPPPRRRQHRRDIVQEGLEHGGVAHVGSGDHRGQRQPATVAEQMELGPRLATIDRICAHMVPPRLARTLMVSTLARDQSSRPALPNWSKTIRWSASNTPAFAHSLRRWTSPRWDSAGEFTQVMVSVGVW
jgi:hypothetical protein